MKWRQTGDTSSHRDSGEGCGMGYKGCQGLPSHAVNAESLGSFKTRLDKVLRSVSCSEPHADGPNGLPSIGNELMFLCSLSLSLPGLRFPALQQGLEENRELIDGITGFEDSVRKCEFTNPPRVGDRVESAFHSLARFSLMDQVIPEGQGFGSGYTGRFTFKFWQYGHWQEVEVDDFLPTVKGELIFLRSRERGEFWSPLLEKAYAKLKGGYHALHLGFPHEALVDMTGGVTEEFQMGALPRDTARFLRQLLDKGSLINCANVGFWQYGHWQEVEVDDFLPTVKGELIFLRSRERGEFWSPLLEKAYAKLKGGYHALHLGFPHEALVDMTGGVTEEFQMGALPRDTARFLRQLLDKGSLINCANVGGPLEQRNEKGILFKHAYTVTGVAQVQAGGARVDLVRVRNPWGHTEWTGAWSDQEGYPTLSFSLCLCCALILCYVVMYFVLC
ncbi:UNVERIFIED_CONTAM: hypothetical protein FKN15_038987 [Acipenser sinensis]